MTRTQHLLAELIALPSVNPAFAPATPPAGPARGGRALHGEKQVADFLAATAAKAGLDVDFQQVFQDRANVIIRLAPQGKIQQTVILAPHMDTVGAEESQLIPRRKNGRLHGRGACDTKGCVAAMLAALCEVAAARSRPQATQIVFVGLVDEEYAQAGSRAFAAHAARLGLAPGRSAGRGGAAPPVLAIVGEPTRLQLVTAHKGSLWLRLETRGRAAHGSTPHLGKNAVRAMARVVETLEGDYAARLRRRKHPLLGPATVNVGSIAGGTQPNIVPAECHILVDRRTLPGETDAGVIREIAGELRARGLAARISNTKLVPSPALETDVKLPLVRQLARQLGQSRPVGVDYFCDAAVLAAGGIPSVVFGPGDIAQAHTADEWISLAQLERGKEVLAAFLKSLS
jgi:acetylornithine deacetylase/succinyl-diaminopimelate desuccinylase-like protein